MFYLVQRNNTNNGGNKNFLAGEYHSEADALKSATDQLQNINILEVWVVERKITVKRTVTVDIERHT